MWTVDCAICSTVNLKLKNREMEKCFKLIDNVDIDKNLFPLYGIILAHFLWHHFPFYHSDLSKECDTFNSIQQKQGITLNLLRSNFFPRGGQSLKPSLGPVMVRRSIEFLCKNVNLWRKNFLHFYVFLQNPLNQISTKFSKIMNPKN